MNELELHEEILRYVRDRILQGSGEDLDVDSPLLEWGILNSLELVRLRLFLETEMNINIADDQFTAENFASIRTISRLIRQECSGTQRLDDAQ